MIQTLQKKQLGDAILGWHKATKDSKVKRQSLKMVKFWDIEVLFICQMTYVMGEAIRPGLSRQFRGANYKHCFHIETSTRTLDLEAGSPKQQSKTKKVSQSKLRTTVTLKNPKP